MRGHIIVEDRFLHQGIDHHLFVTQSDDAENEYRFEVRRIVPGQDQPETIYEKTKDFSKWLCNELHINVEKLLQEELTLIRRNVFSEEEYHAHDP